MKKFKLLYTIDKEAVIEAKNEDDVCNKFWNTPEGKDADRIEEVEEI